MADQKSLELETEKEQAGTELGSVTESKHKGEQEEKEQVGGATSEAEVQERESKSSRRKRKKLSEELEEKTRLLEEKEKELEELRDLYVRKLAEFDNYRKRTQREFVELVKNANADLILQLLPVVDDLERSLKAAEEGTTLEAFVEGVRMIYQKFVDVLSKQGLQRIESVGQPFDPHKHEALMQVEKEGVEPGTVVDEHQPGYVLNERVLRHAKVIVSK
ncbi:MAG: nucleotide exchange factor GrpE [Calditrichaeota bacterium]|nr:nucleotide exchange factor GrpE [Calditrichota bacterium]